MERDEPQLTRREQMTLVKALRIAIMECQERGTNGMMYREMLSEADSGLFPRKLEQVYNLLKGLVGFDPLGRDAPLQKEERPKPERADNPKATSLQDLKRRIYDKAIAEGKTQVIDLDLKAYFDNVRHHILMDKVAKRIEDKDILHLLKLILKASGKKGVPQGGVISPLLSNLYLNEVDRMLEGCKDHTREGERTVVEYARYADDLVVLVRDRKTDARWLQAIPERLREGFAKIQVEINEEKSRVVDLTKGESFGFLGFEFRRVRSLKGRWRPNYAPKAKKRTELLRSLKEIFRSMRSQPIKRVVDKINPIIRGWVNFFRIGHSSQCFSYIRLHLDRKVRRHLMRARKRRGFGWKRWSSKELLEKLGLFHDFRVKYFEPSAKALPNQAVK